MSECTASARMLLREGDGRTYPSRSAERLQWDGRHPVGKPARSAAFGAAHSCSSHMDKMPLAFDRIGRVARHRGLQHYSHRRCPRYLERPDSWCSGAMLGGTSDERDANRDRQG